MLKINNVHIKHNGILADGSTKLTMYLPECTNEQHVELIKKVKGKGGIVGVILMHPEELDVMTDAISSVISAKVQVDESPVEVSEEETMAKLEEQVPYYGEEDGVQ